MIIVSVVICAGCSKFSSIALFKPGADFSQKQYDLDRCIIASLKIIPQVFVPNASTSHFFWEETYVFSSSIDKNESLRKRFIKRCLKKRGYSIINTVSCRNKNEREHAMHAKSLASFICNPDPTLEY